MHDLSSADDQLSIKVKVVVQGKDVTVGWSIVLSV